jgi:putative FmdB family regulatory protein
MPIYEYECDKCGHAFEREQRMSDPPVKSCPKCRGRKVTKLISRSSFVLKGGGWYADGYADASAKKKSAASDSGSTSESSSTSSDGGGGDSSGSSEKKSESKPAKASDKGTKASSRSAA